MNQKDNTVGSLSQEQMSIIIGSALGDGCLRRGKGRRNALLEVNHSYRYKPYVDWKYCKLRDIVRTSPKARKGKGVRVAYRFTTLSIPELTKIYQRFYQRGTKIVPSGLIIDPLLLAVWFMDDGSKSRSSVYFNTQQFSVIDQQRLLKLLREQFGIGGSLNKDKIYYRIRISTDSTKILKRIIRPYILPVFQYKLEE